MRNKIDRLKQLLIKTLEYKNNYYKNRDSYFYSKEAELARLDLNKRYEELEELIIEAFGGTPSINLFGYTGTDVFANAYSSLNDTAAFYCLRVAPEYLSKVIAYHGGKKVKKKKLKSTKASTYIKITIIKGFNDKNDVYNYKKLTSILEELNDNYSKGNAYASSMLIRTILDHTPPLYGYSTFNEVVNNKKWGKSDQKHFKKLYDFRIVAEDALHRPITDIEDLIEMDSIPEPIHLNTYLQLALKIKQKKLFTKKKEAKPIIRSDKILTTLLEEEVTWADYSVGRHIWSSFRIGLKIDNFNNNKPDYFSARLEAKYIDGVWKADNYIFEEISNPTVRKVNEQLRVEANEERDIRLFISDKSPADGNKKRKMPNIDRDTLRLLLSAKGGYKQVIIIKPGWLSLG